jgi:hypothetical protein
MGSEFYIKEADVHKFFLNLYCTHTVCIQHDISQTQAQTTVLEISSRQRCFLADI